MATAVEQLEDIDRFCAALAARLGQERSRAAAGKYCAGAPRDAMYPLHRFVHGMVDEEA